MAQRLRERERRPRENLQVKTGAPQMVRFPFSQQHPAT